MYEEEVDLSESSERAPGENDSYPPLVSSMPSEQNHRDGARDAGRRRLEGALLALLIECHPLPLTLAELVAELGEASRPGGSTEVERAVDELAEAGLLRRRGVGLIPTPAALRVAEIELGLP